jgi:transposase
MLDALVSGTTDPRVLADLARGQLRKKLPALRQALEGRFDPQHALVVGQILAHMDFLDESIDRLSVAIEDQIAPSRQRLSCCARSPACSAATPR